MKAEDTAQRRIGIIADLHGTLPRAAVSLLETCDEIICAGDLESESTLSALESLGPLTAVRGNMDRYGRLRALPRDALFEVGGRLIYVIHDLADMDIDPAAIDVAMVVHGHTHVPSAQRRGGTLYVNPGSATRPRNKTGPTLAVATLDEREIRIEHRFVLP